MDPTCSDCGYDYRTLSNDDASSTLVHEVADTVRTLRYRRQTAPTPDGSWSALEYAGHLRDVLIVTRERTLHALREESPAVVTMGADDRVRRGEYANLSYFQTTAEISEAARRLAATWNRLSTQDWARTLRYNYPTPAIRELSWLAAHIVHEVVHHRSDIERLTTARKAVSLSPDYGAPWGLWSSNPPRPSPPASTELLTPANFGFPDSVVVRLRTWLDAWTANFADAPSDDQHTWRRGFDVAGWLHEGDTLADLIAESLPDYTVERQYRTYAANAVRRDADHPG